MRAIFVLVVLVGCSHAMPQELGAPATPVIVVDAPAAATNVEPAALDADLAGSATQQGVNRQGLAGAGIADNAGGAGAGAFNAGGAGAGGAAAADPNCRNRNPYGCAFYGPGLNNPTAVAPLPEHIKTAQGILTDPTNPAAQNLRVRVHADGTLIFTNQYGEEVEILDQFELGPFEPIDPAETGELMLIAIQQEAQRQIQQHATTIYSSLGLAADGMTLLPTPAGGAAGGAATGRAGNAAIPDFLKRRFTALTVAA